MIEKLVRMTFPFLVAGYLATSLTACTIKKNAIYSQKELKELFATLYLGDYGLNYPSSDEALQACKSHIDEPCINVYERVNIASNKIREIKSTKSLSDTFDTIRHFCISDKESTNDFVCHGAFMSFYFYAETEHDAMIFQFIKSLPVTVQSDIINRDLAWFHNRPTPEVWIEYLDGAPIEWPFPNSKEHTKSMFLSKGEAPLWSTRKVLGEAEH